MDYVDGGGIVVMVSDFLNAVTIQLGTTFGSTYKYYVENVEQGLTKPCFTVDMLTPLERSKSAILYDRTMPLVVHFFNEKSKTSKMDAYKIAEQLVECLEYIPFKNTLIRGENINWHMIEDVLQLFITYRFTTKTDLPFETAMEDLNYINKSKLN